MEIPVLPIDVLVEIFSHWKSGYSLFKSLSRDCRIVKVSWDGWDSLIEQGFSVKIDKSVITWTKNDQLHALGDLPAVEYGGNKWWYKNGKLHRGGDLPAAEYGGNKWWYKNGKLHRDGDLPAIEWGIGRKEWLVDSKLHRDVTKGPAIDCLSGKEWYINGIQCTEQGKPLYLAFNICKEVLEDLESKDIPPPKKPTSKPKILTLSDILTKCRQNPSKKRK